MPFSLFAAPRPALPARRARFLSATLDPAGRSGASDAKADAARGGSELSQLAP